MARRRTCSAHDANSLASPNRRGEAFEHCGQVSTVAEHNVAKVDLALLKYESGQSEQSRMQ